MAGENLETIHDVAADILVAAPLMQKGVVYDLDLLSWNKRIEGAAERDERLMLSLMLYAVEDFVQDWATDKYKSIIVEACKRLGLEYRPNAHCLQGQIEDRLAAMDGVEDRGDLCHED